MESRRDVEPSDPLTAERIYERRWALTLLDNVFGQLADEYRKADKAALFDWLKQLLPDEPGAPAQAEIALKMGMTENAVNQAFYRFRQPLSNLTTGRDRPYRSCAKGCRGRVAALNFGITSVMFGRIFRSTSEEGAEVDLKQ